MTAAKYKDTVRILLLYSAGSLKPIDSRHINVEKYSICRIIPQHSEQFIPIHNSLYRYITALFFKIRLNTLAHLIEKDRIVITDYNPHDFLSNMNFEFYTFIISGAGAKSTNAD